MGSSLRVVSDIAKSLLPDAYMTGGVGCMRICSMENRSVFLDSSQNLRFDSPGMTPGIEYEMTLAGLEIGDCWRAVVHARPFATSESS